MAPRRLFAHVLLSLTALGGVGCPPPAADLPPAQAQAGLYFWGIRRDCKRDALMSAVVEKRLSQLGYDARRVWPVPQLENAPPGVAALEFQRSCEPKAGVVLGGHIEERRLPTGLPLTLMRLWRVDLATQQTSFLDHYCRGCDVMRVLATQAAHLAEQAGLTRDTAKVPGFCLVPNQAPKMSALPPERVLASLTGVAVADRRVKAQIAEAIRAALAETGRELILSDPDKVSGLPVGTYRMLIAGQIAAAVVLEAEPKGQLLARVHRRGQVGSSAPMLGACTGCDLPGLGQRLGQLTTQALDAGHPEDLAIERVPLPADLSAALCSQEAELAAKPRCPGSDGRMLDSGPMPYAFHGSLCGEPIEQPEADPKATAK